jgi:hypothetical protein
MHSIIAAATLALALASCASSRPMPPAPQHTTPAGPSVMDWRNCVSAQAKRLAFAPGTPTEIAEAALGLCKAIEGQYVSASIAEGPGVAAIIMQAHPQLREDARLEAIAIVLELRVAPKKTPSAPVASPRREI